jgi:hypothetical protein
MSCLGVVLISGVTRWWLGEISPRSGSALLYVEDEVGEGKWYLKRDQTSIGQRSFLLGNCPSIYKGTNHPPQGNLAEG